MLPEFEGISGQVPSSLEWWPTGAPVWMGGLAGSRSDYRPLASPGRGSTRYQTVTEDA